MKKSIIKIKDIEVDDKLLPRAKIDNNTVKQYIIDINNGDDFPPVYIGFYKGINYLIDGRHRLEAYSLCGEEYVQAEIKTNFISFDDMFLASIRANLKHGKRLNKKDKVHVTRKLIKMEFNLIDISKLIGFEPKEIEKLTNYKMIHVLKSRLSKNLKEVKNKKEIINIVDKETEQLEELQNIYDFFKNTTILTHHNKIKNKVKKIKILINKKFVRL